MSRFDKIAARLDAFGLDAMLVTSGPNRLYAAGFPSSAGLAVITKDGSWFFTDSRYIEAARRPSPGRRSGRAPGAPPPQAAQIGEARGSAWATRRLHDRGEYESLRKALPCEMVPATKLVMDLRCKGPGGDRLPHAAQRIAEKALTETLNFIRPGRTEQEIAAFLQYQMLLRGAEKMSFEPIVVSGPNSSMPHGVPSDKPVAAGDFITMDFGCVKYGYCSDMTRTVAVGHVTEEMEKVYHTVLAAQQAGIATAKAGVPGKAVHEAGAKVIADAGYGAYFGHGFGHGLGVEVHEQPGAAPSCADPLPVGAVISAEPGIYLPGKFGVRIEDIIIIEEGGCRDIMEAPKDLLIL